MYSSAEKRRTSMKKGIIRIIRHAKRITAVWGTC